VPEFVLKRPCANCPFRTDIPGFLRRGRAVEIAEGIAGGALFACHKTTGWDDEAEMLVEMDSSKVCAGSLIVQERQGQVGQMLRIAERLNVYDPTRLDMEAPVARSLVEFVEHHAGEDAEPCAIVEDGCLAPAGLLVGGMVVPAEREGEVHECPSCGSWVCDACSNETGTCSYCAEVE
jgi:hypothetical protein